MFNLQPLRHISTLPNATVSDRAATCRNGTTADIFYSDRKVIRSMQLLQERFG